MIRLICCIGLMAGTVIMTPRRPISLQKNAEHGSRQAQTHEQGSKTPSAAIQKKTSQRGENPSPEGVNSRENPQAVRLVSVPPVTVRKGWAALAGLGINVVLATVGIVGVIVAVCTLLTINEQVSVTARSARAAEKAARAAQQSADAAVGSTRAWLLVEDVQMPFESFQMLEAAMRDENEDARYFTVRFRNYGQSPAFVEAADIRYSLGGSPDTPLYPGIYSDAFTLPARRRIIPPFANSKETLRDCWIAKGTLDWKPRWVSGQALSQIRSKQMYLWAYGVVRYRDVHRVARFTRFCYRYDVPPDVPYGHEHLCMAGSAEYNDAS